MDVLGKVGCANYKRTRQNIAIDVDYKTITPKIAFVATLNK